MIATARPVLLLALCYTAFIFLGLPDALLSIAWPTMSREFELPLESLGILLLGGTLGYMISSFLSGPMMARLGIAWLLLGSSFMTGFSLVLFVLNQEGWTLPLCAVVAGLGGGGIDAGLNTYVEEHYSDRVMQWLHASFGVGVTIGPLIMTLSLAWTGQWRPGYLFVLFLVMLMATAFFAYRKLWDTAPHVNSVKSNDPKPSLVSTLKRPGTWLGGLCFFLYTGVEIGVGFWAFTLLTESRQVEPLLAGFWVSVYWGAFTLGRIAAGLLADRISAMRMSALGILLSLIGLVLFIQGSAGPGGAFALAIIGLAYAPVFPALISTTDQRVGREHVSNAVGMQIAAAGLGMMVLPPSAGLVAATFGFESLPIFIFILTGLLALVLLMASRVRL